MRSARSTRSLRATRQARARPWARQYDYWVPAQINYPRRPLTYVLDAAAAEVPDRIATHFLGATLTYREIARRAAACASGLAELGVRAGDRVGLMLPNCPQYVIAAFAVLRLGAAVVNINPTSTARELQVIGADAELRALITLDQCAGMAVEVCHAVRCSCVIVTTLAEYAGEPTTATRKSGVTTWSDLLERSRAPAPVAAANADAVAVLQYTGGLTGTTKAAMLTHANIFANVVQTETFVNGVSRRGAARYLMVVPYHHTYGFTIGMMRATWIGARQILLPKYDLTSFLEAIRDCRPTNVPAVPTVFRAVLQHPRMADYGLERVRTFSTGAAPCPLALIEDWEAATGRTLYEGFGLTEASPVTHLTPQLSARRPGTVGVPVPDTEITVVDVTTGAGELPQGAVGELCVSGPQVMKGYWRNERETRQALTCDADGRTWLHTGDIARIDADGFTTIVGRKKDMVIVNGLKVYPREVEQVLQMCPGVLQAAAVGVPHRSCGEVVDVYVVVREPSVTVDQLVRQCAANLAPYKRPRRITICGGLPLDARGEIDREALRQQRTETQV
jgi:long-chain acyl-CoA synthetase